MLKFSADIILLIDNEMRVLDANENALSILGISRENLVGNLIETVKSPLIARLAIPDVFEEIQQKGKYNGSLVSPGRMKTIIIGYASFQRFLIIWMRV